MDEQLSLCICRTQRSDCYSSQKDERHKLAFHPDCYSRWQEAWASVLSRLLLKRTGGASQHPIQTITRANRKCKSVFHLDCYSSGQEVRVGLSPWPLYEWMEDASQCYLIRWEVQVVDSSGPLLEWIVGVSWRLLWSGIWADRKFKLVIPLDSYLSGWQALVRLLLKQRFFKIVTQVDGRCKSTFHLGLLMEQSTGACWRFFWTITWVDVSCELEFLFHSSKVWVGVLSGLLAEQAEAKGLCRLLLEWTLSARWCFIQIVTRADRRLSGLMVWFGVA